jgi:predicted lipoprotein with Yx(FWY)xxD motif
VPNEQATLRPSRRSHMRQVLKFLLPAALASLALAACGSSSSSSSSSQAAAPAESTGTQANASSAQGAAVVKTMSSPTLHSTVLVNSQGMTLYHLSGEAPGKFICTSSACVQVWHPVTVTAAATPSGVAALSTVKRPDGTVQVAYKGAPLYTFTGDKNPGEAKGQGLKDVGTWMAATTSETATPSSQSSSQPASSSSSSGGSEASGSGAASPSSSGGSESSGSGGYSY